jgi:CMP-N,N'-diacetyllegionaminic acid synthase
MASDTAPKVPTILHATSYVEKHFGFMPDIVVDLDITVPLRIPADIDSCVRVLESNPELDAAVSVYEAERNPYYNMVEYDGSHIKLVKTGEGGYTRRQDAPDVYSVSGSTFGYRRSSLETIKHLYEGTWGAYTIPRNRGIDIDTEVDFELVSTLLARQARQLRRS